MKNKLKKLSEITLYFNPLLGFLMVCCLFLKIFYLIPLGLIFLLNMWFFIHNHKEEFTDMDKKN